MTLPTLPKNPKVDDLIPTLVALDTRITTLEAYVKSNDTRISALEKRQTADATGLASHQAGAVTRQAQMDTLAEDVDTLKAIVTPPPPTHKRTLLQGLLDA